MKFKSNGVSLQSSGSVRLFHSPCDAFSPERGEFFFFCVWNGTNLFQGRKRKVLIKAKFDTASKLFTFFFR